jgi:O-antigen ligase
MAGAFISVLDLDAQGNNATNRALAVLPNYLYWGILLIFLVNIRGYINHLFISKHLAIGLVITVVYVLVFPIIPKVPGFTNAIYLNNFAFICICFSSPAAVFILRKYGFLRALIFISIIVGILLIMGRRAGVVLVFLSGLLSISFVSIKFKNLLIGVIISFLAIISFQIQVVENLIYTSSPRIHELIYSNEEITTEDRSYLTRRLMVEKSLLIFNQHPFTGVGLNNFGNINVNFKGDFEGAEYVINKNRMNELSSHNSYAALLAEGGLILIVPFLIILLFNFFHFIKSFPYRNQIQNAFYWSFLAMCVHLYFITAIVNVYAWFLIGIVTALSVQSQKGELKWLHKNSLYKG